MFLKRRTANYQLVWDFETDSAGRCRLLIWQLPKLEKLSSAALQRIRLTLKPHYAFSDIDVFSVGENTIFDDADEDNTPDAFAYGGQLDSDIFYNQI
jgi:hypothetical protein